MEVIMSYVHESSSMENEGSTCPDKPTISKKKNRRTKYTPERRYNKRQREKERRSLYDRENPDASTVSKGVEDTKATNDMTEPDNDASKKRERKKRKRNNKTLSTEAQDMVTINKDSTKILEGIAGSTGVVKLNSKQKHMQRQRQLRRMYNLFAISFQKQQLDHKQTKSTGMKADLKKKLLILDVNGVLAQVVYGKIDGAHYHTRNDSIFKRPHLDSFLEFCLERFNVGIWSTKQYKNLLPVVEFLLPNWKEKLLFIWDGSRSTKTKKNTFDNKKPIQFKHLGKFWESNGPCKSWVKGNFNKSNTLLVDDSPYKALINPKNTAIFPSSYDHLDKESDDLLGTNGNMRGYLEGVAKCEHVQKHVEQHPFGQPAMDENHQHWDIYKTAADSIDDFLSHEAWLKVKPNN